MVQLLTLFNFSGSYKHIRGDIPTPAAARYCARGQPSPPQPTINTEVFSKFNCPVNNKTNVAVFTHSILLSRTLSLKMALYPAIPCTPSSGRRSCLLYRSMSSLLRADLASRGVSGVTLSYTSYTEVGP